MCRPIFLWVASGILLLSACKSSGMADAESKKQAEIEMVVTENYSGFEEEQLMLIKNKAELLTFYGRVNRTRKPGLEPPIIDFKKEMLLVWCGGETDSDVQELEITTTADEVMVRKKRSKNASRKNERRVSPFTIYKMPMSAKTLRVQ